MEKIVSLACVSAARACPSLFLPPRQQRIHQLFFLCLHVSISKSDINYGFRMTLP